MRKSRKRKKQRKVIMLSMICLLCITTAGYAAFQTNLNISAKGNIVSKGITPSELKNNVVTSGDGLYLDEYESGKYIYKGANPDNYITFNNETWRIMSVESDGTLKIIRNESIGNKAFDSKGYRDSTSNGAGGTYCESSSFGCNAWATSDNFVNGSKSGTVLKDAELNTYLNTTYLGTINEDSKYIVNHNFNVGTPGDTSDTEDIATAVTREAQITWNGKISLMTMTEILKTTTDIGCTSLNVAYSNMNKSVCSNNNWLWPTLGYLWTVSPFSGTSDLVWFARSDGYATSRYGDANSSSRGVAPVLYLTPNITLSGEGTNINPYTINS